MFKKYSIKSILLISVLMLQTSCITVVSEKRVNENSSIAEKSPSLERSIKSCKDETSDIMLDFIMQKMYESCKAQGFVINKNSLTNLLHKMMKKDEFDEQTSSMCQACKDDIQCIKTVMKLMDDKKMDFSKEQCQQAHKLS